MPNKPLGCDAPKPTRASAAALYVSEIAVRGWVYIITTKSMPGLIKVGFTHKDPNVRAQELGRTGLPHPYVVEFEVFVTHPKAVEKKVHAALRNVREAKEWFRCSVWHAASKIREAVGSDAILGMIRGPLELDESAAVLAAAVPKQPQKPALTTQKGFRRTATYTGPCTHCGSQFAVTLTRYDSGARCPSCFKMNDTSEFERQQFII